IFIALLLASITLQAGELVFHWNKMCENKIFDMEFMPDNDYFVIVTANEFQVRRTEDGEIVNTYKKNESFSFHEIEFTPDSSKLIVAYDSIIEMRSVKDFSILNTYKLPADAEDYTQYIMEIKVDPIRPYIYVVLNKQKYVNSSKLFKRQIFIINSENLKEEGKITTSEDENLYLQNLALSNDGKYMAVSNEGGSKLIVWNLETKNKINEYWLCPPYHGVEIWGLPSCIKFSELNSDKIYISGTFPQTEEETDQHSGLFIYSITENKIIDSTFGVGEKRLYEGNHFVLFENDNKLTFSSYYLTIINLKDMSIDYQKRIKYGEPGAWVKMVNKNNIFIGYSAYMSMGIYDPSSIVLEFEKIVKTLYPNPTNGLVNIDLNCNGNNKYYEIYDSNSVLIKRVIIENCFSILQIDLSNYNNAIYFIKICCDSKFETYKVIKEN
ncbi:MAG TPA: T9SS type A sorting domain-containing protein, partial [Candidatus Kapabacteria bacterium]|nr:T9SS type A sorting domain-containing protein [Candidatus Kapabacteria bacterium]